MPQMARPAAASKQARRKSLLAARLMSSEGIMLHPRILP
jgi:hypothetical protein